MPASNARKKDRVLVVYPPNDTRRSLVEALRDEGFSDILVLDDGDVGINTLLTFAAGEKDEKVPGRPLSEIGLIVSHFSDLDGTSGITLSRLAHHNFHMDTDIALVSRPDPKMSIGMNRNFADSVARAETLVLDLLGITSTTVFGSDAGIPYPVFDVKVEGIDLRHTGCSVLIRSPFLPARVAELLRARCS